MTPCSRCGKQHDSDKCPNDPAFWVDRGRRIIRWRKRGGRAGGLGKSSNHRIVRVLAEIRGK